MSLRDVEICTKSFEPPCWCKRCRAEKKTDAAMVGQHTAHVNGVRTIDTMEKAREMDREMGFLPVGPIEGAFKRAMETPARVYLVPVEVSGEPDAFLEVASRAMFAKLQLREREIRREFGAELIEWAEQNVPEEMP